MSAPPTAFDRQAIASRPDARDAFIAGRLVTAYALNEQLSPFDLRVEVRAGVVTLGGIVDDKVLRALAADIARQIEGVEEVCSEIAVESPAPRGRTDAFARRVQDASIAAQVKSRLLWNGDTHGESIDVNCRDGVVTLNGAVRADGGRECAERLARETRGVVTVENQLTVEGSRNGS